MTEAVATAKVCAFVHPDGRACGAVPQAESDYCFFHDPARAGDRKAAQAKGGSQNAIRVLPAADLRRWREGPTPSSGELVGLLADTVDAALTGRIDPRVANTVGYLAGVMLKALEYDAFNERLQAIEEAVGVTSKRK